jgi:hypothetical protein
MILFAGQSLNGAKINFDKHGMPSLSSASKKEAKMNGFLILFFLEWKMKKVVRFVL